MTARVPSLIDYIVQRLADEGIEHCFGVPGDCAFPVCDAVDPTMDFGKLVVDHRAYITSGAIRSAERRESQLIALRSMMKDHAEHFYASLWANLRRNRIEADLIDLSDAKCMTSDLANR